MIELDRAYKVTIYQNDWISIQQWCEENIGKFNEDWYKLGIDPTINLNNGTIETTWYFKTYKNAVLFSLRWS